MRIRIIYLILRRNRNEFQSNYYENRSKYFKSNILVLITNNQNHIQSIGTGMFNNTRQTRFWEIIHFSYSPLLFRSSKSYHINRPVIRYVQCSMIFIYLVNDKILQNRFYSNEEEVGIIFVIFILTMIYSTGYCAEVPYLHPGLFSVLFVCDILPVNLFPLLYL